jgi:hypothetical protein
MREEQEAKHIRFLWSNAVNTGGKKKRKVSQELSTARWAFALASGVHFRSRYQLMRLDEPELSAPCAMRVVITIQWELQSAYPVELVKQSIARAFSNKDPPANTAAAKRHQVYCPKLEDATPSGDDKKIVRGSLKGLHYLI